MTVADMKSLLANFPDHYPVEVELPSGRASMVVGADAVKDSMSVNSVRIIVADAEDDE